MMDIWYFLHRTISCGKLIYFEYGFKLAVDLKLKKGLHGVKDTTDSKM
jgi:hypothetical protein